MENLLFWMEGVFISSKRSLLKKFSMLHRQFGFIVQNIMDNLSLQMSLQAVALLLTL